MHRTLDGPDDEEITRFLLCSKQITARVRWLHGWFPRLALGSNTYGHNILVIILTFGGGMDLNFRIMM
jgi:hypothetical protein